MTEFLFPLSTTELFPPLSMTELYPPLSTLTEFSSHIILIQNISPAGATLVHSNPYDKITPAITNDVAVFLINNTLFYMQIYSEWSVRMVYNFLDLTQNGLCFCTNRYLIYRRILNIWLSFQRHIMYRHDFISLVQHKLRLPTLTLRQIKVLSIDSCEDTTASYARMGGGRIANTVMGSQLTDFLVQPAYLDDSDDTLFIMMTYVHRQELNNIMEENPDFIAVQIPIPLIAACLTVVDVKNLCRIHGFSYSGKLNKEGNIKRFEHHYCSNCEAYYAIFKHDDRDKIKKQKDRERKAIHGQQPRVRHTNNNKTHQEKSQKKRRKEKLAKKKQTTKPAVVHSAFPPRPASDRLIHRIISGFCNDTNPSHFEEAGCAVCGQLTLLSELKVLNEVDICFDPLINSLAAKVEKKTLDDPDDEVRSPILDPDCSHICKTCQSTLKKNKRPLKSLANHLWIGKVPEALQGLTYAEKMLIARVRHNRCLVRVSSGRAKMIANAIMFTNPTVKVYKMLPPSR